MCRMPSRVAPRLVTNHLQGFPLGTLLAKPAIRPTRNCIGSTAILQLAHTTNLRGHSVQKMIARVSRRARGECACRAASLAQTCNTADRSVLLILDASGSMNAKLPNGETRIAVAQRAIKGVAGFVPAGAQLSLRMYGAQSPARQKNCQDTNLAVPFGAGERQRRRHHHDGRRREGAGLHADRLFARAGRERLSRPTPRSA